MLLLLLACFVTEDELHSALDRDGDGVLPPEAGGADCDNDDRRINPRQREICGDGVDNNCDGAIDDEGIGNVTWFLDSDSDGWGTDANTMTSCSRPSGYAQQAGDCNDQELSIRPGVPDTCDGLDTDCDGAIDDDAEFALWHPDDDGDLAGDRNKGIWSCNPPDSWTTDGTDCDDSNPDVTARTWYADADGDRWGVGAGVTSCDAPDGHAARPGDCDDTNAAIHPDALETCGNGFDDDCDGSSSGCGVLRLGVADHTIDDALMGVNGAFMEDIDGDGLPDILYSELGSYPSVLHGPIVDAHGPASRVSETPMEHLLRRGMGPPRLVVARLEPYVPESFWKEGVAMAEVLLPVEFPITSDAVVWEFVPGSSHTDPVWTSDRERLGPPMIPTADGLFVFAEFDGRVTPDDARATIISDDLTYLGVAIEEFDVTGDGAPDLLLSDPRSDAKEEFFENPSIYVFHDSDDLSGSVDAVDASATLRDAAPIGFGTEVHGVDLNQDGYLDIAVRSPAFFSDPAGGHVDVLLGPLDVDLDRTDAWMTMSEGLPFGVGWSDVDHTYVDGEPHLVVGAPVYGGPAPAGRVYVLQARAGVATESDAVGILESASDSSMGGGLLTADVDGDGLDDLIATGSPYYFVSATHVFLGSSL